MKIRKATIVTFVVALLISIYPIFADGSINNYMPEIEIINGQKYLDGLPYKDPADIMRLNEQQIETSKFSINSIKTMKENEILSFGSWYATGSSSYYTAQDRDRQSFYSNPPREVTFTTTSKTTATITGNVAYDFPSVAKASMSCSIGSEYGKTVSYTVVPQPYYVYEQKSACEVLETNYQYNAWHGPISASTHDYQGVERWFWSNPL